MGGADLLRDAVRVRAVALALACTCVATGTLASAYEDRVIDPARLGPALSEDDALADRVDPAGPPRSLSVELRAQSERIDGLPTDVARWLLLRGTLDTANHGFFTLDASARLGAASSSALVVGGDASRSASFTVFQRRLPFDGGWSANNGAGVISTGAVDVVSQQTRFGVGSRLVLGASTEWINDRTGWAVTLASGEPIVLDPVGQGGYAPLGGRASVFGLRWKATPSLSYAFQAADFRAGNDGTATVGVPPPSSQGLVQSLRWQDATAYLQVNLLSTRDDASGAQTGAWLDAGVSEGAIEQRLGLNWLPSAQQWLGAPIVSNTSGGYYRWRWRSRQWLAEAQIDQQWVGTDPNVASVTSSTVSQGWVNLRYQFDQRTAFGAQVLTSRNGGQQVARALAYRERFDEDASWRGFVAIDHETAQAIEWQAGVDGAVNWNETRLSGALAALWRSGSSTGSDASVAVTRSAGDRLSFNAGLRRFFDVGGNAPALSLNTGLQYRLAARWVLSASLNESRGARVPLPTGPTTGAPDVIPPLSIEPRVRLAWLGLRYDASAGSAAVALGGTPGGGGGQLDGIVFLDSNGNGVADPGETRLPNVTVVLDGRYAVRTDAQGHFEFAFVVAGPHQLTVLPDNIPLPWGLGESVQRSVTVRQREATTVPFGALRN
jgi:hypothetical protein